MELPDNEVYIWYFNIDDFSNEKMYYAHLLSAEEIAKFGRFKFPKDQKIHIFSRGLLRVLSGYYLGQSPKDISFKYGEYGKPDYNFVSPVKFNVSHSGNFIVLAFVKDTQIGVDVEKIKTNFDTLRIAENFFSTKEIEALRACSENERAMAFYRCWTRKEAFIKAKGSGLSFPLISFTVSLDDGPPRILRTEWDPLEKLEWKLHSFRPHSGYIGALALRGTVKKVSHYTSDNLKGILRRI